MNFTELVFLPFLAVVLVVYWGVRDRRLQNAWILAASLVFYGWHEPKYVLLLLFVAALDYVAPLVMQRWPRHRNAALVVSLVVNLGTLGLFKYLDFFLASFLPGVEPVGLPLPPGISFFTFQSMSYTIDAWRGRLEPRRSFVDYFAYISLFPQLVAGPVERARDLLPQLEAPRRFTREGFADGISLALRGAVKKVVIADTLALYVDTAFARETLPGPLAAAATLAFTVQILADFSGYTDMARGVAAMMGFRLVQNFDAPYAATSPSDFWRRWHISFSSWIHEYLYVPLGGSRYGWARTAFATVVAMLLSGLWHGAAWNFVAWGAWHAALLLAWRAGRAHLPEALRAPLAPLRVPAVFVAVVFGWYLFRVPTLPGAPELAALASPGAPADLADALRVASLALVTGAASVLIGRPLSTSPGGRAVSWAGAALLLAIFARDTASDFLYFRF